MAGSRRELHFHLHILPHLEFAFLRVLCCPVTQREQPLEKMRRLASRHISEEVCVCSPSPSVGIRKLAGDQTVGELGATNVLSYRYPNLPLETRQNLVLHVWAFSLLQHTNQLKRREPWSSFWTHNQDPTPSRIGFSHTYNSLLIKASHSFPHQGHSSSGIHHKNPV